jgi:signal transduction histidine kinase
MNTWDDVKKKIQNLEKDPFLDADMLRTLDTISIADYWRRRFEEEHSLWERRLGGKDEENRQLKDRLERQSVELQLLHQQLESARTQLMDKMHYWEERNHALELDNRSLKDRMDWEVKSRVLEEQNRFLAEQVGRRPRAQDKGGEALDTEGQAQLQEERQKAEQERQRALSLQQKVESLEKLRAEWEQKAIDLERSAGPLKEENTRLQKMIQPLTDRLQRLKKQYEEYMEGREKERLATLEDLGRGFAHRVRNFLGIMSGTLQLCLSNYKMEKELEEQITLVDQNAQEMLKAIEEFLSLSRVPEMTIEDLDLNGFLTRAMAALEDKTKAANVRVQWDLAQGLPPVKGDARLLTEAVVALTMNAVEAMPEGGRLDIQTFAIPQDHKVAVRFHDTGKGINDSHIRKVFQPYFTTKKNRKGLGLTVGKRVMDLHRGALSVESVKGEGTTIVMTFPYEAKDDL